MRWPADVAVPPPVMRGRPRVAPAGDQEGQLCLRTYDGAQPTCFGRMELVEDDRLGSCTCHLGHPPCGWCVSSMPTCTTCGHRVEDGE